MSKRQWYAMKAAADKSATIDIYDVIGGWDGVSAKQFVSDLRSLGDVDMITVNLNSPGGAVFDGNAIYNRLAQHPAEIHVNIDGWAASIASIIAMAGDTITMAGNSMMMIHNPWTIALGSADDLRHEADMMDKAKAGMVNVYAARSGQELDAIAKMMDQETWFTAEEAKSAGFATAVTAPVKMAARFDIDLSGFKNVPEAVRQQVEAQRTAPPLSVIKGKLQLLERI